MNQEMEIVPQCLDGISSEAIRDTFGDCRKLTFHRDVMRDIMNQVGSRPPETGGIFVGPIGSMDVTHFHFDQKANCSGGTYSPDCDTLRHLLKTEWREQGLDFKGFAHSHPNRFDHLSSGDLQYIHRLLAINPEDDYFVAPIVIPSEFRLVPWMVLRGPDCPPVPGVLHII